jgi:hypothetical protein
MTTKPPVIYEALNPHWCNLFENAVTQIRVVVDEKDGRDWIIEMLKFGKRMHQANYCTDCTIDKQ